MKPHTERYGELKDQIARYIFGIRGKRENPVSLRQIHKHFYPACPKIISACLNDLLTEMVIDIRRNSPRSGHSHRQGFCYVPAEQYLLERIKAIYARGMDLIQTAGGR